jgi:hypothetical protein
VIVENKRRAICNPLKIFPNDSYIELNDNVAREEIWILELTATLTRIFINADITPAFLFFINRNAISGSIIVKDIQYPFTIGDTPKAFAELTKPSFKTSKKSSICVVVPMRCPMTSTAMINVKP